MQLACFDTTRSDVKRGINTEFLRNLKGLGSTLGETVIFQTLLQFQYKYNVSLIRVNAEKLNASKPCYKALNVVNEYLYVDF